jgi:hypothetical protein
MADDSIALSRGRKMNRKILQKEERILQKKSEQDKISLQSFFGWGTKCNNVFDIKNRNR